MKKVKRDKKLKRIGVMAIGEKRRTLEKRERERERERKDSRHT